MRLWRWGIRVPKTASVPQTPAPGIAQHPAGTLNILITPPPRLCGFLSDPPCSPFQAAPAYHAPARPLPGRGQATLPRFPVTPPSASGPSRPHSHPGSPGHGYRAAGSRDQESSVNRTSGPRPTPGAGPEGGGRGATPPLAAPTAGGPRAPTRPGARAPPLRGPGQSAAPRLLGGGGGGGWGLDGSARLPPMPIG